VNASDPSGLFGITDALGIGSSIAGGACFVGGFFSAGAGLVACGFIATTISFAANASEFASSPTALGGASAGTDLLSYGCAAGSAIARMPAVYNACGAGATAASGYADALEYE
jgi:hypothetical protein